MIKFQNNVFAQILTLLIFIGILEKNVNIFNNGVRSLIKIVQKDFLSTNKFVLNVELNNVVFAMKQIAINAWKDSILNRISVNNVRKIAYNVQIILTVELVKKGCICTQIIINNISYNNIFH